jgi:glycosyltransferase involved in cell wall biosynthesis
MYLENREKYYGYSTSEKEETKGLCRADVIIAIQQREKDYFSKITQKKTITVGHIGPLEKLARRTSVGKTILFVGSRAGHNIHGIKHFLGEVLPAIRNAIPDVRLLVVGEVCRSIDNYDGCIKLGEVDDIKQVYETVDVVINPSHFGTGLSIKTIEALGYSKPVVTTSSGSKGLNGWVNKAYLVADGPEDFSQSIIRIFRDDNLAERLSKNAYEFAKEWNETNMRELAHVLR